MRRSNAARQGGGSLSKLKTLFCNLVNCLKCWWCCCGNASSDEDDLPLVQQPPSTAEAMREWNEHVAKALDNPMTISCMVYFGSMMMCLTILFARRRDTTAEGVDKAIMGVEMGCCFSIVTVCFYKLLSVHTVQTMAHRLTRWYERTNAAMLWMFTSGWMTIYTTRIPHEVFCSWMWIIFGGFMTFISFITIAVGCMGRVKVQQIIHGEPERRHQE